MAALCCCIYISSSR